MIRKTTFRKKVRFVLSRMAKKMGILQTLKSISREKYNERISASIVYGVLSAVAVNWFFQPGHVYSSGATGLSQVIYAISERLTGHAIPISVSFYLLNVPLLILAWNKIGHKFTIFTFITVSLSSLFIQIIPHVTLTNDPIINAIFGGIIMGTGVGYSLKSHISSGGTDIVSLTIRKKTGRDVGNISLALNGFIMVLAGALFGWRYALYSMIAIFMNSRMTNLIYTKQKKMQAMIITSFPEKVTRMIHTKLHRGVTCINDAEGTYNHEKKSVLLAVITRAEYDVFKYYMKKTDPTAFVSISENVQIIGRFADID